MTQITRLRGVTAAMPVSQQSLGTGQLLVIGGPQAAATVTMRPDLSTQVPLSTLWGYLDQRQGPPPGLAVPGTPARLEITASMAGGLAGQLGPVSATVIVQDAYGLAYELPAGVDGRGRSPASARRPAGRAGSHIGRRPAVAAAWRRLPAAAARIVADLQHAAHVRRALAIDGNSVITISSIAASATPTGPFAAPFAAGRALARWRVRTSAPGLETIIGTCSAGHADGSRKPSSYRGSRRPGRGAHPGSR